jgi:succinate dehydrogenase / fumarate reductase cytochrome b subunit
MVSSSCARLCRQVNYIGELKVNPFFRSSIGRKYIVGVTGILLVLFVIGHMLGNLQIFLGQKALNDYAAFLKSIPGPLWAARIGLLAAFVIHLALALRLKWENVQARPASYAVENTVRASMSSKIMALSGTIILLYVVGHILHFTTGTILPEYAHLQDDLGRHDVYTMVVKGFQIPLVSIAYVLAMCLLWSHLSHGISSVFQTLGFRTHRNHQLVDRLGPALSTGIVIGYVIVPLSILFGFVR